MITQKKTMQTTIVIHLKFLNGLKSAPPYFLKLFCISEQYQLIVLDQRDFENLKNDYHVTPLVNFQGVTLVHYLRILGLYSSQTSNYAPKGMEAQFQDFAYVLVLKGVGPSEELLVQRKKYRLGMVGRYTMPYHAQMINFRFFCMLRISTTL